MRKDLNGAREMIRLRRNSMNEGQDSEIERKRKKRENEIERFYRRMKGRKNRRGRLVWRGKKTYGEYTERKRDRVRSGM